MMPSSSNNVAGTDSPEKSPQSALPDSDVSEGQGTIVDTSTTDDPDLRKQVSCKTSTTIPEDPEREERIFTERVMTYLWAIKKWDWLDLFQKMYITGLFMTTYVLCPRLLNVLLAWLISLLQGLDFYIIIVCTFWAGLACFLFPPVPGVPVYLFGGFVISAACHQTETQDYSPGAPHGFWWGALISIGIGFFLKLAACAMQQKLIGERLGYSVRVRQQVRVHKPMIRAIEAVLRSKGYSIGKVAILCGGPDWPTSVMAGIMKLSLWEMEVGTIPIILFVAPCCLSGAFYMRKDESEFWDRLASLMIASTLIVNLVLWIAAAWAIQETLESNHWDLSKPLLQNVELEWLDYREETLRGDNTITFGDVPRFRKYTLVLGAVIQCIVGQLFYWLASTFFTEFPVNGDIKSLNTVGSEGLIRYPGLAGLVVCLIGICCYIPYWRWQRKQLGETRATKLIELSKQEADWKENYIKRAEEEAPKSRMTLGHSFRSSSTSNKIPGDHAHFHLAPALPAILSFGGAAG